MKNSILLLAFLFCFCFSICGQTYSLADTTMANRLLVEADTLYKELHHKEALVKIDTAQAIFEQAVGKETKEVDRKSVV